MSEVITSKTEVALPVWEACEAQVEGGSATALEAFIYHNEPATLPAHGFQTEDEFRTQLAAVLREARADFESENPPHCHTCRCGQPDEKDGWRPIETWTPQGSALYYSKEEGVRLFEDRDCGSEDPMQILDDLREAGYLHWMPLPAPPGAAVETSGWRCKANRTADPPQDCDAPFCGCDAAWTQCIEWLQEAGWGPTKPSGCSEFGCPIRAKHNHWVDSDGRRRLRYPESESND